MYIDSEKNTCARRVPSTLAGHSSVEPTPALLHPTSSLNYLAIHPPHHPADICVSL